MRKNHSWKIHLYFSLLTVHITTLTDFSQWRLKTLRRKHKKHQLNKSDTDELIYHWSRTSRFMPSTDIDFSKWCVEGVKRHKHSMTSLETQGSGHKRSINKTNLFHAPFFNFNQNESVNWAGTIEKSSENALERLFCIIAYNLIIWFQIRVDVPELEGECG